MRFYAVRTEAIHHTHQALQRLRHGRCGSGGPSRALRVAQLYGHLQVHADAAGELRLGLRDLAAAWHLQPRQLRDDLNDLQALGWLRYEGLPSGTRIRLRSCSGSSASANAPAAAAAAAPPLSAADPDDPGPMALIRRFADEYNRHRPASWPGYVPRSNSLAGRLRRAIAHAGAAEPFWQTLRQALAAMPPFWRDTYPQGRSGGDCVAALLSTDRQGAGLGVEFWHVFRWAQAAPESAAGSAARGAAADGAAAARLAEAHALLAWDGHHWRGQGMAAAELSRAEKLRHALTLEAAGFGEAGAAMRQYGPAAEDPWS